MFFNIHRDITKTNSLQMKNGKYCKIPSNLYGTPDLPPCLRRVLLLVFVTLCDEITDLSRISMRFNGTKSQKHLKKLLKELKTLGYIEINENSFDGWEIRVNYSKFSCSLFKNIPRFIAGDLRLTPSELDIVCFHQIFGFKVNKNLAYCIKVMNLDPKTYKKHYLAILNHGFRFAGCRESDRLKHRDKKLNQNIKYHNCVLKHKFYTWTNEDRDRIIEESLKESVDNSVINNGTFSLHNINLTFSKIKRKILDIRRLRLNRNKPNLNFPKSSIGKEFLLSRERSLGSFLDLQPRQKAYMLTSLQNKLKSMNNTRYSLDQLEMKIEEYAFKLEEKNVQRTFQNGKQFVSYMAKVLSGANVDGKNTFGYDNALLPENDWFVRQIVVELHDIEGSNYSKNYVIWKIRMLLKGRPDFRMHSPKLLKDHIIKFLIKDTRTPYETRDWDVDYNLFDWKVDESKRASQIIMNKLVKNLETKEYNSKVINPQQAEEVRTRTKNIFGIRLVNAQ